MSFCVQVASLDPDEPYPKIVEPRSGRLSIIGRHATGSDRERQLIRPSVGDPA